MMLKNNVVQGGCNPLWLMAQVDITYSEICIIIVYIIRKPNSYTCFLFIYLFKIFLFLTSLPPHKISLNFGLFLSMVPGNKQMFFFLQILLKK